MPTPTRRPFAALLISAFLALPAIAQTDPPATPADRVVASVGGTEITLGHVAATVSLLPEQYQALPDAVLFELVTDQLIRQAALADAMAQEITPQIRAGLDNERRAFLAAAMLENLAGEEIGEEAIEAAYAERYADAAAQVEYNASHILVATREEAEELVALLADGADFATLARDHSIGPTGPQGGNLGWFGRGMMVAPFEEAVVALEPGQVSSPVETQFGWHVVKLDETRAATPPALADVRADIEATLRQERLDTAVNALVAAAGVTQPEDAPDPGLIRDMSIFEPAED
ncbi:MAG TPA: peptidylprolyl isomerase [Rhodobacteraceae bacterium]|jgi:peptidyl-prolyl cis-trans isomerase C|nr:peptidylprolyl isomerase [Paracoccaceae bacterium]HBH00070.1 peptidylprolyl isomerase [Paracoccaceae bacterium]